MKFSWKAFSLLAFIGGLNPGSAAFAGPTSIFDQGNFLYHMTYTTSLEVSAAVPESDYLEFATRHHGFVIGNLAYIRDAENKNAKGSPLRLDGDVKISKVEKHADGSAEITYTYGGEVILNQGGLDHYRLDLPNEYESLMKLDRSELGVCSIYKSASSIPVLDMLPAYWNPFVNRRCGIAHHEVMATLEPKVVKNTYPDYPRLVKNGEITISAFFGKLSPSASNYPYGGAFTGTSDGSAQEFQAVVKKLKALGMVRTNAVKNRGNQTNYAETYEMTLPKAKVRVNLVFGDAVFQGPSMSEYSALYVKAAQEDSMVLYSGHAGFLIDASMLHFYRDMQIQFDPDRYQIFSMNGCQTNYYLLPMFQKKSSKNLDIFVNALETYANSEGTIMPIQAVVNWAGRGQWTSYSELVHQMDSEGAMLGVVGEQDNPTSAY